MPSSAKRAPPTIARAGVPATAKQARAMSALALMLLSFGRAVAADSRLFLIDRNRGAAYHSPRRRDNEDPRV